MVNNAIGMFFSAARRSLLVVGVETGISILKIRFLS
jgi:hypothetical protein